MATNIHVEAGPRENNLSILRRFRKRMKSSGVITRAKSIRYHTRPQSSLAKKERRLKAITRHAARERLYKLGKISEL